MKLLLHACCAPCSVACIAFLREESLCPAIFWHNPNIHPAEEYVKRRDTLFDYARDQKLTLIKDDDYTEEAFIGLLRKEACLQPSFPARCQFCYRARLERTALAAKENGFDAFSTTLFVSPYQNHELLKEEAEKAAEKYGVSFLYRDFRPRFRQGQNEARARGMYMQKYCGCFFSAEERTLKIKKS